MNCPRFVPFAYGPALDPTAYCASSYITPIMFRNAPWWS
jgi:hypothetical protein